MKPTIQELQNRALECAKSAQVNIRSDEIATASDVGRLAFQVCRLISNLPEADALVSALDALRKALDERDFRASIYANVGKSTSKAKGPRREGQRQKRRKAEA